jgi:hypothetical protein
MNFAAESACLTADNIWNEGNNQLVDCSMALCFTVSSTVHVLEFIHVFEGIRHADHVASFICKSWH